MQGTPQSWSTLFSYRSQSFINDRMERLTHYANSSRSTFVFIFMTTGSFLLPIHENVKETLTKKKGKKSTDQNF